MIWGQLQLSLQLLCDERCDMVGKTIVPRLDKIKKILRLIPQLPYVIDLLDDE